MIYILHQDSRGQNNYKDSVKKSCLRRIFFDKFCLRRSLLQNNLVCGALFFTKILFMGHLISVSSLVYRFIGIENDSNFKNSVITTLFGKNMNEESVK